MTARRALAVLVLVVPAMVGVWGFETLNAGTTIMKHEAPKYPEITAEQMVAELSKEQLATMASSSIGKHKQMEGLWRAGRKSDYLVFFVLVGVMSLLAIALFILLWRVAAQPGAPGDGPASRARP